MLRLLLKSPLNFHNNGNAKTLSFPNFLHLQIYTFSAKSLSTTSPQPIIDYLVNSLGLSPESALSASKHLHLKTTEKPDSVLQLFQSYGFSQTHIANIFTKHPSLLSTNAIKSIKPKLDFLSQNGISGEYLAQIISTDPSILRRSLDRQIIPCIVFLKNFFGSSRDIVSFFSVKRGTWFLHEFTDLVGANVDTLRRHGVPDSSIVKLITLRPRALSREANAFSEIVREIEQMGLDPTSLMFIHGVYAMTGMRKEKWVSKMDVFKSFGWSQEQLLALFVRQPKFMTSSENQIRKVLDFFMTKLGWTVEDITKYPIILFLSFEKRILPRMSVIQALISKGLMKRSRMGPALMVREDEFLSKFVVDHLKDIPQLLDMYHNKMKIL